jgi:putative phosphoesterase
MRILVLSDSHGDVDAMARCVKLTEPNEIFHLGDCWPDAEKLRALYPHIPLEQVPGNCDWGSTEVPERLVEAGGKRFLLMHGHTRNVNSGAHRAVLAAKECGADAVLYGHTHLPLVDFDGTTYVMNPGTVAGVNHFATYGIITISGDKLDCATFRL